MTPTKNLHQWTARGIVIRLEKRHIWPKFVNNVSPAFSWNEAMCHVEGTLLI